MIPQSPSNNREVWRELEEYSRDLVFQGKELYIIAGGDVNFYCHILSCNAMQN